MAKLYKVSFTFSDSYRHESEGMVSVTLVVVAIDQFAALSTAWEKLSSLSLPEPKSFEASRVGRDS